MGSINDAVNEFSSFDGGGTRTIHIYYHINYHKHYNLPIQNAANSPAFR